VQRGVVPFWLMAYVAVVACNQTDLDQDGDGFTKLTNDCDDTDPNVHPDAVEVCYNGKDDNCNGVEDEEGGTSGRVWYIDLDGDGYGSDQYTLEACTQPDGFASLKWDCQEDNPEIHPGAEEVCDEVDNDCDGEIDETTSADALTWYPDGDGDGFGSELGVVVSCTQPGEGYIQEGGDCDDRDPTRNPAATENCATELDENCDGVLNEEDAFGCVDFYADEDGDGFAGTAACFCEPEAPFEAETADDCDDTRDDVYPGAPTSSTFLPEDCGTGGDLVLPTPEHTATVSPIELANADFADVDGDGETDVLLGSWARGGPSRVLYGPLLEWTEEAGRQTVLPEDYTAGDGETVLLGADLDGDGLVEVLQRDEGSGTGLTGVLVFPGGEGVLSREDALFSWPIAPSPSPEMNATTPMFRGDPDGDGVPDVVLFVGPRNDGAILWHPLDPARTGADEWTTLELWGETQGRHQAHASLDASADVNGDGMTDLIVGVPYGDPFQRMDTRAGLRSVQGGVAVYEAPVAAGDRPDVVYFGYSATLGASVMGADVDGDGTDDVVAAEASGSMGQPDSGTVWGWLQPQSWTMQSTDWPDVYDADFLYTGDEGNGLAKVQTLTDLDGDGTAEWLVTGESGARHLVQRRPAAGQHAIADLGLMLPSHDDPDTPYTAFFGAPDLTGDGVGELVGARAEDPSALALDFFLGGQ